MNINSFIRRAVTGITAVAAFFALPGTAASQISVMGNTVEERAADPGETYVGSIVVRNVTNVEQPIRIYQTDYNFQADGTSRFDAAGTTKRSNALWISPSASTLILPPSGEMTVSYTVKVPQGVPLNGTYWSAIMVEAAPTAAPAATRGRVGLSAVLRYAVQISTQIQNGGTRTVAFTNQQFTNGTDGKQTLSVDVNNSGERAYHPKLWIEIYDAAGNLVKRDEQQRGLLYPGTSLRQSFALGKLDAGSYKAILFADIGDDAISAAQYQLKF